MPWRRSEIAHSSTAARERGRMLPLDTRFARKVGYFQEDSGSVRGMRAIVLDDRVMVQESRPAPNPGDGEVLVRVRCAGICETDLQLIKGYMGSAGCWVTSSSAWPSPVRWPAAAWSARSTARAGRA